jgi:hypothetical protein
MDRPSITYVPRLDATPEAELGALSSIYAFVLQMHRERQKATLPGGHEDVKGRSENDFHASINHTS